MRISAKLLAAMLTAAGIPLLSFAVVVALTQSNNAEQREWRRAAHTVSRALEALRGQGDHLVAHARECAAAVEVQQLAFRSQGTRGAEALGELLPPASDYDAAAVLTAAGEVAAALGRDPDADHLLQSVPGPRAPLSAAGAWYLTRGHGRLLLVAAAPIPGAGTARQGAARCLLGWVVDGDRLYADDAVPGTRLTVWPPNVFPAGRETAGTPAWPDRGPQRSWAKLHAPTLGPGSVSGRASLLDPRGERVAELVVEIPRTDLVAARRTAAAVFGGALATALLVAAAASVVLRRWVLRPLRELRAGVRRVAAGDLEASVPVRADDEVGGLARDFNQMSEALRESREQLLAAERLVVAGQMATGLAHELNNILQPIRFEADALRRGATSVAPERAARIGQQVDRAAELLSSLLQFAQCKGGGGRVPFGEAAAQAAELAAVPYRPVDVDLVAAVPEGPAWVRGDAAALRQLVVRLVTNACQACGDGDVVRVEVSAGDDHVRLVVTDTGCGIPPDVLERLGQPFVTTKAPGKGVGLGLALCEAIVTTHHGSMAIETAVGRGTEVTVLLPAAQSEDEEAAA